MRTGWGLVVLVTVLSLVGALPASAQGVVSVTIDDLQFDDYPLIRIPVTVRNENGVPITGLEPDRFEIIEDGLASFQPSAAEGQVNPDADISVVMVIDISGSMEGEPIQEAIRAANALIDELSVEDRGAVIAFADEVDLDTENLEAGKEIGFTTDKNALRNVVNFLDTKIGWDTPLYDAILKGVKMVALEPVGRRAVVVMTDGRDERDNDKGVPVEDEGSLSTPDDPIYEANRHNVPIFSVGLGGEGSKIDAKYLGRLAERTGGVYQEAPQPEELTPLFQNVANQLKQQYVLTYDTALVEDDNEHSIMVRVLLPQGQAFNETKFRFRPEVVPTPRATRSSESTPTVAAQTDAAPEPQTTVSVEPTATVSEGIAGTVRETLEDDPFLAVVIGAAVLLLILLIVALVIVLLRGRHAGEQHFDEFEDLRTSAPQQSTGPTGRGEMPTGPPIEDRTEAAPADWPGMRPGGPPAAPPPVPPGPVVPPGGGMPAIEETREIRRAPKHLAMLVERARPERRHDLIGTINVGRAPDNQIVLEDPTVSRHHAWIKAEGEEFLVFDIGSANGTFVNDELVEDPRRLADGDTVRFGDQAFVFSRVF